MLFVDGGRSIEDGVRQRADGGALLAFRLLADPADLCPSPSGELLLRQIRGQVRFPDFLPGGREALRALLAISVATYRRLRTRPTPLVVHDPQPSGA